MATLNIGSIADFIFATISDIPAGVSGVMTDIITDQIIHIENYTGQSIDPNAIEERFQPAIKAFTKADVIKSKFELAGNTTRKKLGELEVESGKGSAEEVLIAKYFSEAEEKLKRLGRNIVYRRTL